MGSRVRCEGTAAAGGRVDGPPAGGVAKRVKCGQGNEGDEDVCSDGEKEREYSNNCTNRMRACVLASNLAWKTPFPQSRLPAYIEFVQKS